ncbi:hypothetical protein [Pleurocapsa sp. PCC 7319]|uniref:hypothetical protein n=1 Tax=Pleurocapsa sp. PCC 7319 TaxID=118161 RepID=UPI00055F75EB|nr:hypothetical protein [Pleurocapsa sp. PCC 7319]
MVNIIMELNQVQRELIIRGYDAHCSEIERLIETRLNTDMIELYEVLLSGRKADIKRYCNNNEIDLLDIDEATKQSIGLNLIEIEIKTLLSEKGRYDAELKELGIRTKRITNGIEQCPWFSMFNSPVSLQWWTKNTEKILSNCDINHKYYDWVDSKIEHIKDVWTEIEPQQALPDITKYWQVYNFEVPERVQEYLVKGCGN